MIPHPESLILPYDAVIFDMDGVVTDTASVHAAAWKRLFDEFLSSRVSGQSAPIVPFDPDADYRQYVDGRSREDGVATFLRARGIELPLDGPGDPLGSPTVASLAARKNELFEAAIRTGVRPFPSTIALLTRLRAGGIRTALVSASHNAQAVLVAAHADNLFDARVDGDDAERLHLPGKPDPALFTEASRRLGILPGRAVVVEDSVAGVRAARQGGFGLVVGVDRGGHRDDLAAAGADVVVGDLAELDLGAVPASPWLVVYDGFDPAHESHREAICTLANGYQAARGAAPESRNDGVHYPGTYLAGVYNRLTSVVEGRPMEHEHMVNAPNWLVLDARLSEAQWLSEAGERVVAEHRELDLRRGILTRALHVLDATGRRTTITQRRLVSMASPHITALETTVLAENWSGPIRVRSSLDGGVVNANAAPDRQLENKHLVPLGVDEAGPDTLVLEAETSQSHVRIAEAARTSVRGAGSGAVASRVVTEAYAFGSIEIDLHLRETEPVTIDKVAALVTSRDPAISSPRLAVLAELARADGFESLLTEHARAWSHLWERFAIETESDFDISLGLNLHVFHLLQSLSPHTVGLDAGVPARGLHGEGYMGRIFWDELFVFPVLNLRVPALTRALLMYRWRRLDAARDSARRAGLAGALFPWQSGSDGREETPDHLFNQRSGRWMPDNSHLQRHVGLAVAYNVWQYYQVTDDIQFLTQHGAELLVEVARLFASLTTHSPREDRYDISGVMGPDEYHDGYPGASAPGLRNNAYTNVMACWLFWRATELVNLLDTKDCEALWERLGVTDDEVQEWDHRSRRLRLPFHADGILSQFEGYEQLQELDWDHYRATYGNIGRLDLILEAEGDTTNRYKLSKQADVLMLFYLFSSEELAGLLGRLGYPMDLESIPRTVEYYLARTAHGSTLSRMVHSWVLSRTNREQSWSLLRDALTADLDDTQGGTTGEGVHLGAMAGTVDLVLRCYGGIQSRDDTLWFDPCLPTELRRVRFDVVYRGHHLTVNLSTKRLQLHLHPCAANPIDVGVNGEVTRVAAGQTHDFAI